MKVAVAAQDAQFRFPAQQQSEPAKPVTPPVKQAEQAKGQAAETRGALSPAVVDTAQPDKERLELANAAAEDLTRLSNRKLKFEYQKESDVFQVSVMDDEDKVIRKIPADSVLRMIEHIREVLGLVLDEKA